jgi:hypothetical protein
MRVPRAYADNNVVSAITRRDCEPDSIVKLLEMHRRGVITLFTSAQSPREMGHAPAQYQAKLQKDLDELERVQDDHRVLGFYTVNDQYGGCICNPLVTDIVDEVLFGKLLAAGLARDDAQHFMYASHNKYDCFLTCDRDFLNRRAALELLCPSIRILKPSELVAEMEGSPGFSIPAYPPRAGFAAILRILDP